MEEIQTKAEVVMYAEYADIPDFGKMYGIEANTEKEQLMSTVVESGLLKVYDVPENQKSDVEEWETKLVENGFELVDQTDADGGSINTYQNNITSEIVVASLAKSTAEEGGYVFILTVKESAVAALPTANDSNMGALIEEQNRKQNDALYLIQDNWVYGLGFDESGDGYFAKIRTEGNDYTKLADFNTDNFCIDNGYIYATKTYEDNQGIYKMRTSGEECQMIVQANEPTIQINNGYIYYSTDATSRDLNQTELCHLYRCNLDGTDVEEILNKRVFYFYVFGDLVLYQDDLDNASLHIYNMNTKSDQKINDQISFCPIYDGNYIYYASPISTDDTVSNIWKVKPDGTENQQVGDFKVKNSISVYDEYIYFANADDNNRIYRISKSGNDLLQITQDTNCSNCFFTGDSMLYISWDDNDLVDKTIWCDVDGSNATDIRLNEW